MTEVEITKLSRQVGLLAKRRKVQIVTAESCTGGGIAAAITRISGSAKYFDRGFVTYANDAKRQMLGVSPRTLKRFGAVSEDVAREMALGALKKSPSDIAISITGIAGPTGAAPGKPVGLVWFGWAVRGGPVQTRAFHFKGGRVEVRMQSVYMALQGLIDLLR